MTAGGGSFYAEQKRELLEIKKFSLPAVDRNRTGTGITTHGILSPGRLPVPPLRQMGEGGFEPPKAVPADLQSVPFGHSGIRPCLISIDYLSIAAGKNQVFFV